MKLEIREIGVTYGGREVLRGCTYSFRRPGIYVLTGENGSGKSTLLRVCALLERPNRGAVEYRNGDTPIPQDMALRRRITLVLPRIGVFNSSVFDNVVYGLRLRATQKKEMAERAAEALEFVRLSTKAKQSARTLSSGETQRLGIARALIIKPDVLFLDEPTASVDKQNIALIEEIIMNLRSTNRLVVMTTHDEHQALRLSDTVLHLDEGILKG